MFPDDGDDDEDVVFRDSCEAFPVLVLDTVLGSDGEGLGALCLFNGIPEVNPLGTEKLDISNETTV